MSKNLSEQNNNKNDRNNNNKWGIMFCFEKAATQKEEKYLGIFENLFLSIGMAFLCDFKHMVNKYMFENLSKDILSKMSMKKY